MATVMTGDVLTQRIRQARRRWQARKTLDLALEVAAVFMAGLVLVCAADNAWALEQGARGVLGGVLLAWLVVGSVGVGLRAALRRPSDDFLAVRWERSVPRLDNMLINAIQLRRDTRVDSPRLVQALVDRACGVAQDLTPSDVLDREATARRGKWLTVLLLVAAVYIALFNPWFVNAAQRCLMPWTDTPHLHDVSLSVRDGNRTIIEGQDAPLAILVKAHGTYQPRRVQINHRTGPSEWQTAYCMANSDGGFLYGELRAVRTPIDYYVKAGHNVSEQYRIDVTPLPRIRSIRLVYDYPDYTKRGRLESTRSGGGVDALVGTRVTVQAEVTKPLRKATLNVLQAIKIVERVKVREGGKTVEKFVTKEKKHSEAIPMTAVGDRQDVVEGQFRIVGNGTYQFALVDVDNLSNASPAAYPIRARQDTSPSIHFRLPGRDLSIPAAKTIQTEVQATDDYGLREISLHCLVGRRGSETPVQEAVSSAVQDPGAAYATWPLVRKWTIEGHRTRTRTPKFEWNLGQMKLSVKGKPAQPIPLKEGDVVAYVAIARDHRGQGQIGYSSQFSITVLAPDKTRDAVVQRELGDLQELMAILALQKTNRGRLTDGKPPRELYTVQETIRARTVSLSTRMKRAVRPMKKVIAGLDELAVPGGPMADALLRLSQYQGHANQRPPIATAMDTIIAQLEKLIRLLERRMRRRRSAARSWREKSDKEKADTLKRLQEMVNLLRRFVKEQDKVIDKTRALPRKPEDFTKDDLKQVADLKKKEDEWGDILTDHVHDMQKLASQDFSDKSLVSEYKEVIENVEQAVIQLELKKIEMAVPLEQSGRELAQKLLDDMEMWFPDVPDVLEWKMEEPIDNPNIPQSELPEFLTDLIGDLIETQDQLNQEAEDVTSGWADQMSSAGWGVMDGPISSYGAQGKTGNQLPDSHELSGRSGDGRSGRSSGQLVENVAKGLPGRRTPTRLSNDDYEKGWVKELRELATGGSTGGGKKSGGGMEGLEGPFPPPMERDLERLRKLQKGIREKTQKVLRRARAVMIRMEDIERAAMLMREVEDDIKNFRYRDVARKQQEILRSFKRTAQEETQDVILRVESAYELPARYRREMLDAMDDAYPAEYKDALANYYKDLIESE